MMIMTVKLFQHDKRALKPQATTNGLVWLFVLAVFGDERDMAPLFQEASPVLERL